mmetsp:Transcript_20112/g.62077  ORF Transcript_20112/g.62077 Transcript_20112/m.62077 type:complete len:203 (+) Transcript_20112:1750-2358(+)
MCAAPRDMVEACKACWRRCIWIWRCFARARARDCVDSPRAPAEPKPDDFSSSFDSEYRSRGGAIEGGFMVGGAMEGGAIFFLREWRPRDGRSKGDLLSCLASPLLSRSRPAMPDRMDRGSPKSSSNSSAFMSILCPCAAARARCGSGSAVPFMGVGGGGAQRRPGCAWRHPQCVRGTPSPRAAVARCPFLIPPHSIKPNHRR